MSSSYQATVKHHSSPSASSPNNATLAVPTSTSYEFSMARLCLGGEIVQVPAIIAEQEEMFREVITKEAYYSLSPEARNYLLRFLPKYENWENDIEKILDGVFTKDENFYFGNPIGGMHSKIRHGWFNPERASDHVQIRDSRKVIYDHFIRHYQMDLLRKLLRSRKQLLARYYDPESSKLKKNSPRKKNSKLKVLMRLKSRSDLRVKKMLNAIKAEVGEKDEFSSDEEVNAKDDTAIRLTAAGRSTMHSATNDDLELHEPIHMERVKDMLTEYKRLKEMEPNLPAMDIADIETADVYERAGVVCIAEKNLPQEVTEAMKLPFRITK